MNFLCLGIFLLSMQAKPMQKGVNFLNGQWSSPKFTSTDAMQSVNLLRHSATDYLALTFCWYQWNITSTSIYAKPGVSPTDTEISFITQYAHTHGAKVMVCFLFFIAYCFLLIVRVRLMLIVFFISVVWKLLCS
jgi:hypothetical protein